MSTSDATAPAGADMPQIDKLRLEMMTFVYAAAVGYGFSILDNAKWLVQPEDWPHVHAELSLFWSAMLLLLWVFLFIAIDWLVIRQVYFEEKAYGKLDFVLDLLIVFFFVRMMHDATFVVSDVGKPFNFSYWWWLDLVFAAYVIWDFGRIAKKYQSLRGTKNALREALAGQKWSLPADILAVIVLTTVYTLSPHLKEGVPFALVVVGTPLLYLACAWAWWHDIRGGEPAATP